MYRTPVNMHCVKASIQAGKGRGGRRDGEADAPCPQRKTSVRRRRSDTREKRNPDENRVSRATIVHAAAGLLASRICTTPSVALAREAAPTFLCTDITPGWCRDPPTTGTFKSRGVSIKYWVYGDLSSAKHLPLVTMHGGPGFPHSYMLPLAQMACRGRPVIFYDQICVGESECTDKSFKYEPQYYVSEFEALVSHLRLQEGGFHLLGHSWGTVVAELYAYKQPRGLRGLVLAGGISEARRYVQGQREDIWADAPPAVEEFILKTEETRDYDNPLYGPVAEGLGTKFTYRTVPAPDCLADALAGLNPDVYVKIQGPSEFQLRGVLETLDITKDLQKITTLTLLLNGRYDTMRPVLTEAMAEALPNATRAVVERSGHVTMIDNPGAVNDIVHAFLSKLEVSV